jgi:hypothetical protein
MGNVGGKIEKSGPSEFEDQAFSVFREMIQHFCENHFPF